MSISFFFLIGNKSFIKIKKEFLYTGSVHESSKNTKKNYGLQESKKSIVEECGTRFAAADHSLREWISIFFISNKFLSLSSKHLLFLSPHMHHNTQWGAALHISMFLDWLRPFLQQASKAIMPEGITHWTPKMLKIKLHNSLATGQWWKRWVIDSPLLLHMQYQFITRTLLLRRLSIVRMCPMAAVHTKKATRVGALVFQILLQGTIWFVFVSKVT